MEVLTTRRLELVPITLEMVEAVMAGDRVRAERLASARLPDAWPGPALIERAFSADLDEVRRAPAVRLWGDRLLVSRDRDGDGRARVVGSVIFHGRPGDGVAEVGYGVEADSQGLGYATEATLASVEWALAQPECHTVTATTFPWHRASLRVIEKIGMIPIGSRDHEILGELLVFGRSRSGMADSVLPRLAAALR